MTFERCYTLAAMQNFIYSPLPPNHIRVLQFTGNPTASRVSSSFTWSIKVVSFLAEGSEGNLVSCDGLFYTWGTLSDVYFDLRRKGTTNPSQS